MIREVRSLEEKLFLQEILQKCQLSNNNKNIIR